jgi:crotonobetainyl-CoA:carnitine CoA-transferase CaiB-like acyl-CoA transferase
LFDFSVIGRVARVPFFPLRIRRLHPRIAPHNVYPCTGEDSWCAIAVYSEEEWQGLKTAMGSPAWADSDNYNNGSARIEHEDELDRLIGRWTSEHERHSLAALLQEHGVRAGAVQNARDRIEWDQQPAHRDTYAIYEHPEAGPRRHETVGARLSKNPYRPKRAAPLMGQDTDDVLRVLLGYSDDRIAELRASDAIR